MTSSRRHFLVRGSATVAAYGLFGCGDDERTRITTGGIASIRDSGPGPSTADASEPLEDAGGAEGPARPPTCEAGESATLIAVGPLGTLALGESRYVKQGALEVYVCRDGGGVYVLSAICSHANCTVRRQNSRFFCPCHGATFDFNGQKPKAPALRPLDHYAACLDAEGTLRVDPSNVVQPSTRLVV